MLEPGLVREKDTRIVFIDKIPHPKGYMYVCKFWLYNAKHASMPGMEFGYGGYCVVQPFQKAPPIVFDNVEDVKKAFPKHTLGFELD